MTKKSKTKTAPKPLSAKSVAKTKDIAWWYTEPVTDAALTAVASNLKPGGFMHYDHHMIPEPSWQQQLKAYARPNKEGLRLQQFPEVCGLYRDDDGALGLMVGYKAA